MSLAIRNWLFILLFLTSIYFFPVNTVLVLLGITFFCGIFGSIISFYSFFLAEKQKSNSKWGEKFKTSKGESDDKLPTIGSIKGFNDTDLLPAYLEDIKRVPLLSHEQEITLGRQVQEYMEVERAELEITELTGDKPTLEELSNKLNLSTSIIKKRLRAGQKAKERIVTANLRLVVTVAKKYTKRNRELLDLIHEGTIGLVRAVEKYDPARGYKFPTYAYWWIKQGIERAITEE